MSWTAFHTLVEFTRCGDCLDWKRRWVCNDLPRKAKNLITITCQRYKSALWLIYVQISFDWHQHSKSIIQYMSYCLTSADGNLRVKCRRRNGTVLPFMHVTWKQTIMNIKHLLCLCQSPDCFKLFCVVKFSFCLLTKM